MTATPHAIAALLGSRICHDLVSPIGAISNGVELLQMAGGGAGPELDLINESVENANARIRFFRIAFGVASPDQRIGASEIRDILADLTRGNRLTFDWDSETDLPRAEVKLAFLMIQCLETALPWGGTIKVTHRDGTWLLTATSDRMREIGPFWDSLTTATSVTDIGAAEVQFLMFPLLLSDMGRELRLERGETRIEASF